MKDDGRILRNHIIRKSGNDKKLFEEKRRNIKIKSEIWIIVSVDRIINKK